MSLVAALAALTLSAIADPEQRPGIVLAQALYCEQLPPGWVAAESSNACARAKYIELPETPAAAQIPDGWVCSAENTMFFEDKMARTVSCIPTGGGQPIALEKELGSRVPASLDTYLKTQQQQVSEIESSSILVAPRKIKVAGHDAVEVATKGSVIFDHTGGGSSTGTLASHRITIEDKSGYYTCSLSASPDYYDEHLRSVFSAFCNSVRFANAAKG